MGVKLIGDDPEQVARVDELLASLRRSLLAGASWRCDRRLVPVPVDVIVPMPQTEYVSLQIQRATAPAGSPAAG